jgi:hypothetical protein
MSTLSGAIANKLMTNTWLDDKISPKYTEKSFLNNFIIKWKFTYGDGNTITRECTYNAISFNDDNTIIYGIKDCKYSAGILDTQFSSILDSHAAFKKWGDILSILYFPYNIHLGKLSVSEISNIAKIYITTKSTFTGNLDVGEYTLNQIQSAISSKGTITVANPNEIFSYIPNDIFHYVSNAGVEYGNNKMRGDGFPPSTITDYIPKEDNSSNRVITDTYFNIIFTGSSGSHNRKGVREDIDKFTTITLYPIVGGAYGSYTNGSEMLTNISYPINQITLIPPTLTGYENWNITNISNYNVPIRVYLTANSTIGTNSEISSGSISYNSNNQVFSANDIAWNYTNNKSLYQSFELAFFKRYVRNTNDGVGATLGENIITGLTMAKNLKIYPGDLYQRNPYITPSIRQDGSFKIYKISYLPYSYAVQRYKHPTINRSLNRSDGLESNDYGAVIPVIYIPSTISLKYSGSVSAKIIYNTSNYPYAEITFGRVIFNVYKYAYGNRTGISSQRVLYDDILDMDKFVNQLKSNAQFSGTVKHTQVTDGDTRTQTSPCDVTANKNFLASNDSSGNLILYLDLGTITVSLYNGSIPTYTTINSITIKMTSTGIDDFLLGNVTSTERTTHIETTICRYQNSTGSGSSSPSNTSLGDDGIDTADYTIGSFDEFDE